MSLNGNVHGFAVPTLDQNQSSPYHRYEGPLMCSGPAEEYSLSIVSAFPSVLTLSRP